MRLHCLLLNLLCLHTFTAESAYVDQTLVKSAPSNELPEHVNLLFIQTTTEQESATGYC